jgi:hypothetical protein
MFDYLRSTAHLTPYTGIARVLMLGNTNHLLKLFGSPGDSRRSFIAIQSRPSLASRKFIQVW